MILGAHVLLYSKDADKIRAFFRDTIGWPHVDAGEGWLIYGLPPAEFGVHPENPGDDNGTELHLMCDDIQRTMVELAKKGVEFGGPVVDQGYGLVSSIRLPDGSTMGLYQPKHPTAIRWGKAAKSKSARPPAKKAAAKRKVAAPKKRKGSRRAAARR
jgi:catechol 2,3-dioxygenase-like lactoylglutathione lyase family enzyme